MDNPESGKVRLWAEGFSAMMRNSTFSLLLLAPVLVFLTSVPAWPETFAEITARLSRETVEAYAVSPFMEISRDHFSRYYRDASVVPTGDETVIANGWRVVVDAAPDSAGALMAQHLRDFLRDRMQVDLALEPPAGAEAQTEVSVSRGGPSLVLAASGGGDPGVPESFTIEVTPKLVAVRGMDANGLRDGIVKLVEQIGLRRAPFLARGSQVYTPRLRVRLGTIPSGGSVRDLVFMGYNAMLAGGGDLHAISTSEAIPGLRARKVPALAAAQPQAGEEARRYGLKTYAFLNTRQKFPKDDPVFQEHPEIRGALTWAADGEYVLCTGHPLVQQYLRESVAGLFSADPGLAGIVLIVGGEGFYHCHMRPFGVEKGHTNCERCEALGAERAVANLSNLLAEAARSVNPAAEVVVWPYSAEHVWSADYDQKGYLELLGPGVALLTEIEKGEYVKKEGGINKHLWDYSIDLIGPGDRAASQIATCKAVGVPVYLKSEPEIGFEAPRLPHIPCMDRWYDRAEALASCGAAGAWVFPAFRPNFGSTAAELPKFAWWSPTPDREAVLEQFAARVAGAAAGPHLRRAWGFVSEAIPYSPELPSYYNGPYYLGPAHPMCANPEATLPQVFYGYYLFLAEMTDAAGAVARPTFVTVPTGDRPVFASYYREMEKRLALAVAEIDAAGPLAEETRQLFFEAEEIPIRWFYHTARTEANFYESCALRDRLIALASQESRSEEEQTEARELLMRWHAVLTDEKANAEAALPLVERDVRLDFYYGSDHTFPHAADMIRAKLEILEGELSEFLPGLGERCAVAGG